MAQQAISDFSDYLQRSLGAIERTSLIDMECNDIILQQRGKIGIAREMVDCDYYDWLEGKLYAVNLYHGEYMAQYGWSETTNAGMKRRL